MAVGDTTTREVSTESPIVRISTAYLRLATIICDSRCCKLDLTSPRMLQAVNRASHCDLKTYDHFFYYLPSYGLWMGECLRNIVDWSDGRDMSFVVNQHKLALTQTAV